MKVWIENDFMGSRHVMVDYEHEKSQPFKFATVFYTYPYTDNQSTLSAATRIAVSLGAKEPVEQRQMKIPEEYFPKKPKPKLQHYDGNKLID